MHVTSHEDNQFDLKNLYSILANKGWTLLCESKMSSHDRSFGQSTLECVTELVVLNSLFKFISHITSYRCVMEDDKIANLHPTVGGAMW